MPASDSRRRAASQSQYVTAASASHAARSRRGGRGGKEAEEASVACMAVASSFGCLCSITLSIWEVLVVTRSLFFHQRKQHKGKKKGNNEKKKLATRCIYNLYNYGKLVSLLFIFLIYLPFTHIQYLNT